MDRQNLSPTRVKYGETFPICQIPSCRAYATEIHEISRGVNRSKSLNQRCALLSLCRLHHHELHNTSQWPLVVQYAIKAMEDPEGFNRRKLNDLRGRADEAISMAEVCQAAMIAYRELSFGPSRTDWWVKLANIVLRDARQ